MPLVISSNDSLMIIAFPLNKSEATASWENETEVLPGAYAAIESINNHSTNESGGNLRLVLVDSGYVTSDIGSYSGNLLELIANLSWNNRLNEIVGIAGLIHPNVLQSLRTFELPTVSLIHFSKVVSSPNLIYMAPSISALVKSVIALIKNINQHMIGVFTETNDSYFGRVSEELIKDINCSNFTISVPVHLQSSYDLNNTNAIFSSQLQVIFVSADPSVAVQVLCTAYINGLVWPQYLWILHSIRLEDLTSGYSGKCTLNKILEGVILMDMAPRREDRQHVPSMFTKPYNGFDINSNDTVQYSLNPFTNLMYDAVWLLNNASRENSSLKDFAQSLNASGASGLLQFSDQFLVTDIVVYQVINLTTRVVGVYDVLENILVLQQQLSLSNLENFNQSSLLPTFIILYFFAISIFILNTVLLLLFICFRKDPDIKSTSVVLSLLIFIGCYLLTGFAINGIVFEQRRLMPLPSANLCVLNTWLSGIGISVPLILATLLVKMLQVYYIFTRRYKRVKPGVFTHNCSLVIYTFLIIFPNVIVLTIWSIVDPFQDEIEYGIYAGFNEPVRRYRCTSNHETIFFGFLFGYFILLSIAVVIVAIKTRKVRLLRFKDTKKVNLLIFLLLFIVCFALSCWLFLMRLYEHATLIVLCSGNLLAAFLCQILLFIPKVWPPLTKKFHCICPQKFYRTVNTSTPDHESHSTANYH